MLPTLLMAALLVLEIWYGRKCRCAKCARRFRTELACNHSRTPAPKDGET